MKVTCSRSSKAWLSRESFRRASNRLYDCEVLIARAERMKNWDAVARLNEYAESLTDQIESRG